MKIITLAVLSMTAALTIAAPANAKILRAVALPSGAMALETDNRSAPGDGFTLLGCGTIPGTTTRVCRWQAGAPQQVVAEPQATTQPTAPAQPVAQPNVSEQNNPMIGNVLPTTQTACQTGAGSFRCATVQPPAPKPSALAWVAVLGALTIGGIEASHNNYGYYGGGSGYAPQGGYIRGGSCGGCDRTGF